MAAKQGERRRGSDATPEQQKKDPWATTGSVPRARLWPQGRTVRGEQRGQEARVREAQRGGGDRGPPDDAARVDGREDGGLRQGCAEGGLGGR